MPSRKGNEINSEWLPDGISHVSYRIQNTENNLFSLYLLSASSVSLCFLGGHF